MVAKWLLGARLWYFCTLASTTGPLGLTDGTRAKTHRSAGFLLRFGDDAFMLPLRRAAQGTKSDYLSRTAMVTPSCPHSPPLPPVRAATASPSSSSSTPVRVLSMYDEPRMLNFTLHGLVWK